MSTPRTILTALLLLFGATVAVHAADEPSKGVVWFYRLGSQIDRFAMKGLDTAYIALPEFRWRVALTNGEMGFHGKYTTWVDPETNVDLRSHNAPSVELGFNAGFRSLAIGYSWDLMKAYSTNWNLSLGSKRFGLEFQRNVSTNLTGQFVIGQTGPPDLPTLDKGDLRIANTSLGVWWALNAQHYSHNAAIKQSYIQKRTAGSLLLSACYISSHMSILDSLKYLKNEDLMELVDGVTGMITRQVALGIGYGINYTPNQGKVLLHAAANLQLVCFSVNHISYQLPHNVYLPGEPQYVLHPAFPVHVSGNMRAAVSWEINRWVHLSAWAQANNLRFESKGDKLSKMDINNWLWQARLNVGVRFGTGKKRAQQVLGKPALYITPVPADTIPAKRSILPQWVTDYFFSSSL